MIENYPITESRNWYRNQVDFLSDRTNVWKFEDGFKSNFSDWLSDIVDVKVEMNSDIRYTKRDERRKLEKTPALIDNIKQLYHQDIEQLYPELAAS